MVNILMRNYYRALVVYNLNKTTETSMMLYTLCLQQSEEILMATL